MHYLSFISQTYSCKNKLETRISEVLHAEERDLIPADELEYFKNDLLEAIHACNEEFPRCKPITASWWQSSPSKDWHLNIDAGVLRFNLYASN